MGAIDDFAQVQAPATYVPLSMPLLSRERFAEIVGLTAATVYSMCDRGYLPTVHFGRRVFINMEILRQQCQERGFA